MSIDLLARWALDSYAYNRDADDSLLEPLLTVVGGDYDALTTVGDVRMAEHAVDQLAFLIGYVGYPCDAVYVTCTWESLSIERPVSEVMIQRDVEIVLDETTRSALLCWAHSIPTSESTLYMLIKHVNDDGTHRWEGITARHAAELETFKPLAVAAHAFDPYPIGSEALESRQEAMRILIEANGATHDSLFYEPGTLLAAARKHNSK